VTGAIAQHLHVRTPRPDGLGAPAIDEVGTGESGHAAAAEVRCSPMQLDWTHLRTPMNRCQKRRVVGGFVFGVSLYALASSLWGIGGPLGATLTSLAILVPVAWAILPVIEELRPSDRPEDGGNQG